MSLVKKANATAIKLGHITAGPCKLSGSSTHRNVRKKAPQETHCLLNLRGIIVTRIKMACGRFVS